MFRLGLTGSIGTGKSTTAAIFREFGIPVYDADAAVHELYAGEAAAAIEAEFPGAVQHGVVDRKRLGAIVSGNPERFKALEAIVHPLVRAKEEAAIAAAEKAGARLIVLDIPLLFETGAEGRCDAILVTVVDAVEQKRRVLARPGMSEPLFHAILARQMSMDEKRRRAHMILDTGRGLEAARADIRTLLDELEPRLRQS
ncbi:MAG: dephospho-CoA [Beijerinckiaceae bacterium]|nr:MAG: dephospho-CoA [Beijerinckiaceae bacterium]